MSPSVYPKCLILGLFVQVSVTTANRQWGNQYMSGGPGRGLAREVRLNNNPSGVNLAHVLAAITEGDMSFFWDARVKEPKDPEGDAVTVLVQGQENIDKVVETNVPFNTIDTTFCNTDQEISPVWPCVMATALQYAGWNIKNPHGVPDMIYATTGIKSWTIYDRTKNRTSVSPETFTDAVFTNTRDGRRPYILLSRFDKEGEYLKKNYAYTATPRYKDDSGSIGLLDLDLIDGSNVVRNYTDIIDDIEMIITTIKPLSVAE